MQDFWFSREREKEEEEEEKRKRREREKREEIRESLFKIRYFCKLWNLIKRNLEVSLTEISGKLD